MTKHRLNLYLMIGFPLHPVQAMQRFLHLSNQRLRNAGLLQTFQAGRSPQVPQICRPSIDIIIWETWELIAVTTSTEKLGILKMAVMMAKKTSKPLWGVSQV